MKHLANEDNDSNRNMLIHNVNDNTVRSFSKDFEDIISFNYDSGYITDSHKVKSVFSEFYLKLTNIYSKHITVEKTLRLDATNLTNHGLVRALLNHVRLKISYIMLG